MTNSIIAVLNRMAEHLPAGERVVLEAVSALIGRSGAPQMEASALQAEVSTRQGRPISAAAFRQRLKRLNDSLKKAQAAFLLSSSGGKISFQPTAKWDDERHTESMEQQLRRHSDEGTAVATGASIPPLAAPERPQELLVMFSYAWLTEGKVGKQLHRTQEEFYEELERQLKHPPERYKLLLPPIKLWRDQERLRTSDRGSPD